MSPTTYERSPKLVASRFSTSILRIAEMMAETVILILDDYRMLK